jgi:periplasmic protein TonB
MSTPVVNAQANTQGLERPESILPTLFGEGYGIYEVRRGSFVAAFLINTLFVAAVVVIGSYTWSHKEEVKNLVIGQVVELSPYVLPASKDKVGGGGGGGDFDKLQAAKGALPKLSKQQITPPMVVVRNEAPKLVVDPTVVVPPEIKLPTLGPMGDPMSKVTGPASNGTGGGGGIGSGTGGGVGSGRGPGVGPGWGGGIGGGAYRVGGGVSAPRAIYQPDPEYSEEARKAKWQGTVVLWVVVGPDGRAHDIRVQRSLGMGLDEKAMEAVRTWKFEPAKKDGQPVAVQVNIEVNFRLY